MRFKISILLFISLIFISGCITKDCSNDLNCFKEASKTCEKARINLNYEDTIIKTTLRGAEGENCLISFKVENVGESLKQQYPQEAPLIKDKTMNCNVPQNYMNGDIGHSNLFKINEKFNSYCSGPLKDLMKVFLK